MNRTRQKMVPELKVGDRVNFAKGVNVLGNRHSGGIFGPWVAKCELWGVLSNMWLSIVIEN